VLNHPRICNIKRGTGSRTRSNTDVFCWLDDGEGFHRQVLESSGPACGSLPRQSCTSGSEQILGGLTPMRITARRIPKHACGSPFRRKAQNNRV